MSDSFTSIRDMLENMHIDITDDHTFLGLVADFFLSTFRTIFNIFIAAIHFFKGELVDLGYKTADIFDGLNGFEILQENFIYFLVGLVVMIFTIKITFNIIENVV